MEVQVQKEKSLFYGGKLMSFIPIMILVLVSYFIAIFFKIYTLRSMIFGGVLGTIAGFFLSRDKKKYWDILSSEMATKGNVELLFIFIFIGVFTQILFVGKIGEGLLWVSERLSLSASSYILFSFAAATLISLGTAMPLIAVYTTVPILFPAGILLGCNPELLLGALMSGSFLGDNLAPSSQITYLAATFDIDPKTNKPISFMRLFNRRLPYIIVCAVITFFIYLFLTHYVPHGAPLTNQKLEGIAPDYRGLFMIIPILILVYICKKSESFLVAVTIAIAVALAIGFGLRIFDLHSLYYRDPHTNIIQGIVPQGIASVLEIIMATFIILGLISLFTHSGAMDYIADRIFKMKMMKHSWFAEFLIVIMSMFMVFLFSGGFVLAVLVLGMLTNKIGEGVGMAPERRGYLLIDGSENIASLSPFTSCYIMGSLSLLAGMRSRYAFIPEVSPFMIFAYSVFNWMLLLLCIAWIMGLGRTKKKNVINPKTENK